jgi:hypothetical protein
LKASNSPAEEHEDAIDKIFAGASASTQKGNGSVIPYLRLPKSECSNQQYTTISSTLA